MAAVLACGPNAALSHRSAADLHELRATDRLRVDVIVPGVTARRHGGIDLHRSRTLTAADITAVDAITCTTVERTVLDLAGILRRRAVERAIEQAEIAETLNGLVLNRLLERNRHTSSAKQLRAIIADLDANAKPMEPGIEEEFYALCRGAGILLPERQVYIDPGDGEPAVRVDFAWRAQRLVVETDGGRVHRTRSAFESDRRRDQRLVLAGWRVLRITWLQIRREPERIARMIVRALKQG